MPSFSVFLSWPVIGKACIAGALGLLLATPSLTVPTIAQEALPWQDRPGTIAQNDSYRPPNDAVDDYRSDPYSAEPRYEPPASRSSGGDYDRGRDYETRGDRYESSGRADRYDEPPQGGRDSGYGEPYAPPSDRGRFGDDYGAGRRDGGSYSENEIVDAGHRFFGSVSKGLAKVVEHAFRNKGRPNGYILGEDAGGAFVAGLRYGEGTLFTKDVGDHKVYWQGPSIGYDFGGEGSKVMVLVYDLEDPSEIYRRFGGVEGSAYLVGGVSVQFQQSGHVTLAPIRSGVGLRLGANVGYLKYTRSPTINPF